VFAGAEIQAQLWRQYGWQIETLFYEVTQTLQCEIKALCYPPAALGVTRR